jgi:hypothetical protein
MGIHSLPRMVCCELVRGVAAVAQLVCPGPEGRRPITAMVADRLIPATTTGVSALSQPAGASRCRTSRSARYPAVIAAPRPPSVRSAAASGRRRRTAIAHACAASITRGADSAVPISTQSRPTVDGCPRQNGMSKAWRRRRASAVPPSPAASWDVATKASTRFRFMARQLNGLAPMAAILKHSLPPTRRPRTLASRGQGHRHGHGAKRWRCSGGRSAAAKLCQPRMEANGESCHGEQPGSSRARAKESICMA